MSLVYPLVHSVGIEFETNLTMSMAQSLVRDNRLSNFQVHHDGSIDRNIMKIRNLDKIFRYNENVLDNSKIFYVDRGGAEIVTPVIDTTDENWQIPIYKLMDTLNNKYYDQPNPLVSIHIHVNSRGLGVGVLQNILRYWMGFEALFYRLGIGEMGIHRGTVRKNFLYCRPMRNPLVTSTDTVIRPSFSLEGLYQAKNLKEFFQAYANSPINDEPPRYAPPRYMAVNFYSYLSQGSVEFRVFNYSTTPSTIFAWVELVQSIVRQSMGKDFYYDEMPLGVTPNNFNFDILQPILELKDQTMLKLSGIYNKTNWIKFDPTQVFSHTSQNIINWSGVPNKLIPQALPKRTLIRRYSSDSFIDDYTEFFSDESISSAPSSERRTRSNLERALDTSNMYATVGNFVTVDTDFTNGTVNFVNNPDGTQGIVYETPEPRRFRSTYSVPEEER